MPPTYASLLRRFQALVADTVIYASLFVALAFAPALLDLGPAPTRLVLVALIAAALLYEPILVAARGGTIGHYRYGLRIIDARSEGRLGFGRAFARSLLKGCVGLPSFLFMLITRRAQSLHDLATGSLVVLWDPAEASALDVAVAPPELPSTGMPSPLRRSAVIAGYSIATLLAGSVAVALVSSPACVDENRCSGLDEGLAGLLAVGWLAATAFFMVRGWRGRLYGCRRRAAAAREPSSSG